MGNIKPKLKSQFYYNVDSNEFQFDTMQPKLGKDQTEFPKNQHTIKFNNNKHNTQNNTNVTHRHLIHFPLNIYKSNTIFPRFQFQIYLALPLHLNVHFNVHSTRTFDKFILNVLHQFSTIEINLPKLKYYSVIR